MAHKDYFSSQSKSYAAFRPTYPDALYDFIFRHVSRKDNAWDCATGNGQVAHVLSRHFKQVYATDISQQQLDHATPADNIQYAISPAEHTSFPDHQIDLITVGQALHWFDREKFYAEARRVLKPDGWLAIWGYALIFIEPQVDAIVMNFYSQVVGPYWDDARKLVEEEYASLSFPFTPVQTPPFHITAAWTLDHLTGYFDSWSATQKFIRARGHNPVPDVRKELALCWGENEIKTVRFPVFLKLGKLKA